MATAVIHIVIAAVQYRSVLSTVLDRGIFNTGAGVPVVGAVVWSLLFSAVAFIGGMAVAAIEQADAPVPKRLGWSLLTLPFIGVALISASGFWLLFLPAERILETRKKIHPVIRDAQPLVRREG